MTAIGYVTKNDYGGHKGQLKTASYRAGTDIVPNRDESADTHPGFRIVIRWFVTGA